MSGAAAAVLALTATVGADLARCEAQTDRCQSQAIELVRRWRSERAERIACEVVRDSSEGLLDEAPASYSGDPMPRWVAFAIGGAAGLAVGLAVGAIVGDRD